MRNSKVRWGGRFVQQTDPRFHLSLCQPVATAEVPLAKVREVHEQLKVQLPHEVLLQGLP